MFYKDEKQVGKKQVYITYFYYIGGMISLIGGIAFDLFIWIYFYFVNKTRNVYFAILAIIFGVMPVIGGGILNWQVNWKIDYDEDGFAYRSKFGKKYMFSYDEPIEIRRTKASIYLYVREIKIRISKQEAKCWEPFMEILTDHQSKFQGQTIKKCKPEFSNKRYSRKMRKNKKRD